MRQDAEESARFAPADTHHSGCFLQLEMLTLRPSAEPRNELISLHSGGWSVSALLLSSSAPPLLVLLLNQRDGHSYHHFSDTNV